MKEKLINAGKWTLFVMLVGGISSLGLSSVAIWKKLGDFEMRLLSDNEVMAESIKRIDGDIVNLRSELKERG